MLKSKEDIISQAVSEDVKGSTPSVYFLIQNNDIVYVGSSTNPLGRIGAHKSQGKIFDSFSVIRCENINEARLLESKYIFEFVPVYNRTLANLGDLFVQVGTFENATTSDNRKLKLDVAVICNRIYVRKEDAER